MNIKNLMEISVNLNANSQSSKSYEYKGFLDEDENIIDLVWKVGILLFDNETLLQKVIKNIPRIFISKLATIYTYLKLKITSSEQFLKAYRNTYFEIVSYIYPYVSLMIGLMINLFHFKKQ